jgi:hypothetical protein
MVRFLGVSHDESVIRVEDILQNAAGSGLSWDRISSASHGTTAASILEQPAYFNNGFVFSPERG